MLLYRIYDNESLVHIKGRLFNITMHHQYMYTGYCWKQKSLQIFVNQTLQTYSTYITWSLISLLHMSYLYSMLNYQRTVPLYGFHHIPDRIYLINSDFLLPLKSDSLLQPLYPTQIFHLHTFHWNDSPLYTICDPLGHQWPGESSESGTIKSYHPSGPILRQRW